MKKLFSTFLGFLFVLSLSACSSQTDEDGKKTEAASDRGTVTSEQTAANTEPETQSHNVILISPPLRRYSGNTPTKPCLYGL